MSEQHIDMKKLEAVFGKETNIGKVFQLLETVCEADREESSFVRNYLPMVKETQQSEERVFLSVLTRTQGRRPQELRETLLCLSAQTDMDFEVLLVGHKVSENQEKEIRAIIDEQVESLKKRIRFLKLDHGNRTVPLNFGFAHARGEYTAILDDDDVVFADWVEQFHNAAKERPGTLLHTYAACQNWMKLNKGSFVGTVRACDSPKDIYCKPFLWPEQMHCNHCPPVGLAFPTAIFQQLGVMFDESLSTTEDWDYLQRVAMLAGVTDIKKVTCIYRWWVNTESSQTVHSKAEWNYNYELIQKKMCSLPMIFPEAGTRQLLEMFNPPSTVQEYIAEVGEDDFISNLHSRDVRKFIESYISNKVKKMMGKKPSQNIHFKELKRLVRMYIMKKLGKKHK
ncbi:glycosyltransferase family 2 protein [Mailhella massiliensis]|uniref:glycosyltransferase family 2 protein n=1 Tax=Mailhella massiliensis TaxID=1903261 RepID=UPI00097DE39F|nr:glycosyltransferase family 2 protein [Mailhella massiliensis]